MALHLAASLFSFSSLNHMSTQNIPHWCKLLIRTVCQLYICGKPTMLHGKTGLTGLDLKYLVIHEDMSSSNSGLSDWIGISLYVTNILLTWSWMFSKEPFFKTWCLESQLLVFLPQDEEDSFVMKAIIHAINDDNVPGLKHLLGSLTSYDINQPNKVRGCRRLNA